MVFSAFQQQVILIKNTDPLLLQNSFNTFCYFLVLSLVIGGIMILVPYFISGRNIKFIEKTSEYECGFEPFDSAVRQPFTIHFYIVGILFLIFDVEISLLFPWSALIVTLSWNGFWLIFFFIIILVIGFLYEWQTNAISWNTH